MHMEKIDLNSLDAIIFDLGGVLINISYTKAAESFKALGMDNFDHIYSQAKQSGLFDQFEVGAIDPSAFRSGIRDASGLSLSDQDIDDAWNSMILDFPKRRLETVRRIAEDKRVFLLSNTNIIHEHHFTGILDTQFGKGTFEESFEEYYYSHRIQKRKPNRKTFDFVINQNQLDPKRTLFIDDSEQHIIGAQSAGINTHWLNQGDVVDLF